MNDFLIDGISSKPALYSAVGFVILMICIIAYWIATGQDAIFGGRVIYDNAKDNCDSLKSYLLEHYGSNYYDEAKERYRVMCEK